MAEQVLTVTRRLYVPNTVANMDYKYGPYGSIDDAYEQLGEDGLDCICNGLTFGVVGEDNRITEYWFNGGTAKENIERKGQSAPSIDTGEDETLDFDSVLGRL